MEEIARYRFDNSPLEVIACLQVIASSIEATPFGGVVNGAGFRTGTALPEALSLLDKFAIPALQRNLKEHGDEVCQHIVKTEFELAISELIFQIKLHNNLLKDVKFIYEKDKNGLRIEI